MITTAQLHYLAEKEGLRFDQAEKDYIILWLLSGLAHSGAKKHGWVFKGGTCLRHCYYEGYRFLRVTPYRFLAVSSRLPMCGTR